MGQIENLQHDLINKIVVAEYRIASKEKVT